MIIDWEKSYVYCDWHIYIYSLQILVNKNSYLLPFGEYNECWIADVVHDGEEIIRILKVKMRQANQKKHQT